MRGEVLKRLGKAFVKGISKGVFVFSGVLVLGSSAFAYTLPTSGFFYDVYDILVNKIAKGPVGTAGGVALLSYGGIRLAMGQWTHALFPIISGGILVKADTLAQSIGMTINF